MIFIDTSAWFASVVPTDPHHDQAVAWLTANVEPLFTTDYIVDETLTLLRARGEQRRALTLGNGFFAGEVAEVHRLSDKDLRQAWEVFRDYDDKEWSFTDCASKIVMENLGITTAFAFDRHFHQFGTIVVHSGIGG